MHCHCQRNAYTKQLADIRTSANLRQHVQERTYIHCHILDHIISHDDHNLIKGVSSMLSDHIYINIEVSLQKQSIAAEVISYRKYKSIDKDVGRIIKCISTIVHCR